MKWLSFFARFDTGTLLTAYFVCQRASTNILLILATTLFLNRVGVDRLPMVYIFMNLAAMGLQFWTSRQRESSSFGLLSTIGVGAVGLTVLVPALLRTTTGVPALILVFAFLIAVRVFEILSGTLFLNIVSELYTLRESKERVPGLLTASSVGVIVSGFSVKPLTMWLSVEVTILLVSVILVFDQVLLWQIGRVLRRVTKRPAAPAAPMVSVDDEAARVAGESAQEDDSGKDAGPPLADRAGPGDSAAPPGLAPVAGQASGAVRRPMGTQDLVRGMCGVAFLVSFLKFLLDFQYSQAVSHRFTDKQDLAGFLGFYESALTVLILGMQVFFTKPLLRKLKLGVAVSLLPGAMVGCSLLGMVWPTFEVMVLAKVIFSILSNGLYNPAGNLLVGPLGATARERARMGVSSATSAGCLLVGAVLQLGVKDVRPSIYFGVMAAAFAAALFLARRLDRGYLGALSQELAGTDVQRRVENIRALRVVSTEYAAEWMTELLADPTPAVRERALREVKFLGKRPARRVLERVLSGSGSDSAPPMDERLRAIALGELALVLGREALELARPHLKDPQRRIRCSALEAVAAAGGSVAEDILVEYLDSTDHRMCVIAVVGLLRSPISEQRIEKSLAVLSRMGRSPDTLARASAAVAMGELAFPLFVGALLELARDPVDQVSARALDALEKLRAPEAVPVLVAMADRLGRGSLPGGADGSLVDLRVQRIRQVCERLEDREAIELMQVMEQLSADERARVRDNMKEVRHSVRAQVLGRALSLASPRARVAVVAYLHRATHAGAPELVSRCLDGPTPTIVPALEAMRSGGYRGEGAMSRLLAGLMDRENAERLIEYLDEIWRHIRASQHLVAQTPESSRERRSMEWRRGRLMSHGFTFVSLLSRRPREVVESLEKALREDRFVASLSLELVAARIGPKASSRLIPLLEELRHQWYGEDVKGVTPGLDLTDPWILLALEEEKAWLRDALLREEIPGVDGPVGDGGVASDESEAPPDEAGVDDESAGRGDRAA